MKTRLMILVAVAAMAAACRDGGEGPGGGPEELRLSGAIKGEVVARSAAGKGIAAGEVVHAWVDEAVNPAVAHVKAWRLEADGNGGLDGAACYFPENGNDVNIYAMHGNFTNVIEEGVTGFPDWTMLCKVERMQAGEVGAANRAKSDLLFAIERGVSRGRESDGVTTRELTFYHLFSKVEVALKASDEVGDLTGAVVSVGGTVNGGYFTPDKEAVMEDAAERGKMIAPDGSSSGPITIDTRVTGNFDGNTEYGEAIAVPGTGLFIRVDLEDGKALVYRSNVKLESGKKYRYNIYVGKERLELVSTSISAWETGTSDGGEAGMMRQVDFSGGDYTIADDGVYCVSGESNGYSLIIKGSPTVYLVDATIEGGITSPIHVVSGNPVIVLVGTNRLTGNSQCSGLYYVSGCKVTLRGEGKLIAESKLGAGIGSYWGGNPAGDLVIESGTIEATGGVGKPGNAGIGGSGDDGCGSITITGGKVTARGSDGAAAIGAGKNGPCSSIVLENCEIHVPGDGKGGLSGANGIVAGSVVPDLSHGEEMREKGVVIGEMKDKN
ncbi:fimbrillin family protein [Butyricimonas paravirosa]|uniref:fimbrillin family protein n=1 Tax=Butyricimonas paravirosa TaxID=1472417 RepID=UPI002A82165C|nr:fimbrillin family protein [Butyricimonas paravirosa]